MEQPNSYNHLFSYKLVLPLLVAVCILAAPSAGLANSQEASPYSESIKTFKLEMEKLRKELNIPGLSVAILKRQELIFADGFGLADVENRIPATANTPYNIASLTKTFAAAVLMKLVQEGQLDLDTEIADILYDTDFPYEDGYIHGYAKACEKIIQLSSDPSVPYAFLFRDYRCNTEEITVRHHLTHTSQGLPGEMYRYNGFLFSILALVVEKVTGQSFDKLLVENIISPLKMTRTVPSINDSYRTQVLSERAKYYRTGFLGNYIPSSYPVRLSSSAGMVSTVLDLAKFDQAMDRNLIVSQKSKEAMFTPARSSSDYPLPYGLGWFIQEYMGTKLVWHYGHAPRAYSSLILKVPAKETTLILLANADGASASFNLGAGNVLRSPFAIAFINLFTDLKAKQDKITVAGAIHNVHRPDDTFKTYIEVMIGKDYKGDLPDGLDSITLTVTSSDGEATPVQLPRYRYFEQFRDFWFVVNAPPALGKYTFRVDCQGQTGTAVDYQIVIRKIPIPDRNTFSPVSGKIVSSKAPTFSWATVDFPSNPIFYRLVIEEASGKRVFSSDRVRNMSSYTIPQDILVPGKSYRWQIRAADSSDWVQIQNRSQSEWQRFKISPVMK